MIKVLSCIKSLKCCAGAADSNLPNTLIHMYAFLCLVLFVCLFGWLLVDSYQMSPTPPPNAHTHTEKKDTQPHPVNLQTNDIRPPILGSNHDASSCRTSREWRAPRWWRPVRSGTTAASRPTRWRCRATSRPGRSSATSPCRATSTSRPSNNW